MGILDKITNKMVEKSDEEIEAQRQRIAQQVGSMWDWLRTHLDAACEAYQKTGDAEQLKWCLGGQALQDTISQLDVYRANNLLWSFPNRREMAHSRLRVDEEVGRAYVVTEYFRDYSQLELYHHDQLVATKTGEGEERALRATIETTEQGHYFITQIALLQTE